MGEASGGRASQGTFAGAAAHGEIVFNCTGGAVALLALEMAGAANLRGKILVDISNPLDVSKGMPPVLLFRGDDSLGERIQRVFPDCKVVKTLNTINAQVMVNPGRVPGDHDGTPNVIAWMVNCGPRVRTSDIDRTVSSM